MSTNGFDNSEYLYGTLNKEIILQEYRGLSSNTNDVKVDNDNKTISVNSKKTKEALKVIYGGKAYYFDGSQPIELIIEDPLSINYITSDSEGNPFASKQALLDGPYYYQGQEIELKMNDYALVIKDETQADATARYVYDGAQWDFQYIVSDSPFGQEQLEAINSGITQEKLDKLEAHIVNKNNPHEVTKEQIGLDQVDNTSDLNKPISNAAQEAFTNVYTYVNNYVDSAINEAIRVTLNTEV